MARKLTNERLDAARGFVEQRGRPLDVALLHHWTGAASAEAALEALSQFQNPDGGFGRGLEPDIPSPASSAIATSIGLRLLARLGAGGEHPIVASAGEWLAMAQDEGTGVWPIVARGVEASPHAPWWSWSPDLAASWNGFRYNPTAEILALLYRFPVAVPARTLQAAEAAMRRTLSEGALIEGAYDLRCAARLAESGAAPQDIAGPLAELVRRSIAAHDPGDEHIAPFDVAPTPTSLFADAVAERIGPALDRLVEAQDADGGWTPFWDWSFVDADAWSRARSDWRGALTREAIETLTAWGRTA